MTVRRSLPYLGIAKRLQKQNPNPRLDHVIKKACEAIKDGLSDEEVEKVVAQAEIEQLPDIE